MNDIDKKAIQEIEMSITDKFKGKLSEAGYSRELKWSITDMLWECIHKVSAEKSEYWEEKIKNYETLKK
jgi:hypothetical protein